MNTHTPGSTERSIPGPAIIGVPYDKQSSFLRGSAWGPDAIREALFSDSSNMWTENGRDLGAPGALTNFNDMTFSGNNDFADIERQSAVLFEAAFTPIFLGGDHSVTFPLIRGLAKAEVVTPKELTIIQFDAHPDTYDSFEDNTLSHACPFARIMEEKLAGRLIQIGIRTSTGHQREQAERFGIETHYMKDRTGVPDLNLQGPVYISIDLDALDPAYAPGVSHIEPGGLSVRQILDVLHAVNTPLLGADVVELNPKRDLNNMTAYAAAKFVKELAGMTPAA